MTGNPLSSVVTSTVQPSQRRFAVVSAAMRCAAIAHVVFRMHLEETDLRPAVEDSLVVLGFEPEPGARRQIAGSIPVEMAHRSLPEPEGPDSRAFRESFSSSS